MKTCGLAWAAATLVALFAETAASQTVRYTVTDLGTLGGASQFSSALAINNHGQVVGYATDPTTGYFSHAFYWAGDGSPMLDIGTFDGQITSTSIAYAINDSGVAVGQSDYGNATNAFLWTSSGTIQNLGSLGGTFSDALAVDSVGTVVGGSLTAGGVAHGFLYRDGIMVDTGLRVNVGINDSGEIAAFQSIGTNVENAYFINRVGQAQDIGSFGGTLTQPYAINGSGQIVGFSNTIGNSATHAFLYSNGVLTNLGMLDSKDTAIAFDINNEGMVVGESYHHLTGNSRAFLYSGLGPMTDLNSLVDASLGWTLEAAYGINDQGQIVGLGISPNGNEHAFLLTPTPEPSSFALLAIAAGSLLVFAHYRPKRFK